MSQVRAALRDGAARLRAEGIDNPRLEARLLLAHALGVTPEALLRDPPEALLGNPPRMPLHDPPEVPPRDPPQGSPCDSSEALLRGPLEVPLRRPPVSANSVQTSCAETGRARYDALLDRRAAREPLALITGRREFWSLDLAVSAATLIPRPDSETLIEAALAAIPDRARVRRILDLGTGTGCLLLAALSEFPPAFGVGTDRTAAATSLARHNAAMLGMADRAAFVCTDWGDALVGGFDLIVSNPPYIRTGDLAALMPEVARHEPAAALDGGPDGLDAYRRILPELPRLLASGGVAVLELGVDQNEAVTGLARVAGFASTTRADLAGIPRALLLRAESGR
jgi:release factor glutamine methyltransferase